MQILLLIILVVLLLVLVIGGIMHSAANADREMEEQDLRDGLIPTPADDCGAKASNTTEQLGRGAIQTTAESASPQAGKIAGCASQGGVSNPTSLTSKQHNAFPGGRW